MRGIWEHRRTTFAIRKHVQLINGEKLNHLFLEHRHNGAATCDFQQCGILTSVDSDEPVQSPIKFKISKICSVSSFIFMRVCTG